MRLEAKNVAVTLGSRPVLNRVSLAVEAGEVVGLIGPNGAGKSTLLRALAAIVASTGSITIDGIDLASLSAVARASRLAFLPQQRVISWPLPVSDVVMLGRLPGRRLGARPSAEDRRQVEDALTLLELQDLRQRPATALSGGEQARVLMARAVAQASPLLLADEPAAGLDPAHQIQLMMVLRQLAAAGRGVLVSLHDLGLAARWCDRVLIVKQGALLAEGRPEAVLTAETLRRAFGIEAAFAADGLVAGPVALAERVA